MTDKPPKKKYTLTDSPEDAKKPQFRSAPRRKRPLRPELEPLEPGDQAMFGGYITSKAGALLEKGSKFVRSITTYWANASC